MALPSAECLSELLYAEASLGEWMWIWMVETERRFEELRPSLVVEIEDAANFLCEAQRHPMKKTSLKISLLIQRVRFR